MAAFKIFTVICNLTSMCLTFCTMFLYGTQSIVLPESEDFSYHFFEHFCSSISPFNNSENPILTSIFLKLSFILHIYLTFCPEFEVISLDLTVHGFSIMAFFFFWICPLCFLKFLSQNIFEVYLILNVSVVQQSDSGQILSYYRLL